MRTGALEFVLLAEIQTFGVSVFEFSDFRSRYLIRVAGKLQQTAWLELYRTTN